MIVVVSSYTTIRVSVKDKERLERLAKLLGYRTLTEALRYALDAAEKELERREGSVEKVLASLRYAKDIGITGPEDVDEALYGGDS